NLFFPDTVRIITEIAFYGSDENVNTKATLDFDAAGNIIFMENANEHLFFISPPSLAETNSFTTTSPDTFTVEVSTSVSNPSEALLPNSYRLEQNYPNPFNPSTSIKFNLKKAESVSILVYDLKGRLIRTLIDREDRAEGAHTVEWDGTDNFGQRVASGRYVYALEFGDSRQSKVMTLSK
ncbi:MAG: FlgD immunoglobulin-like domain containing protein, partial [bacterium]